MAGGTWDDKGGNKGKAKMGRPKGDAPRSTLFPPPLRHARAFLLPAFLPSTARLAC